MTQTQTSLRLRHSQAVSWSVFLGFWKFCKLPQEGTSNEMALQRETENVLSPNSWNNFHASVFSKAEHPCTLDPNPQKWRESEGAASWLQHVHWWKPNSEMEDKWHLPLSLPVLFGLLLLLPTHWLPALLPSLRYEHLATGKEILGYRRKKKNDQINSLLNRYFQKSMFTF